MTAFERPRSVSLVIPCFNEAHRLEHLLPALWDLHPAPLEVIVVDDGSDDDTASLARKHTQVKLVRHESNSGLAVARDSGWKVAQGDVVAYLDADVWPPPGLLAALLEPYDASTVAGVGGGVTEGYVDTIWDVFRKRFFFQNWGSQHLNEASYLFGCCFSFRKSSLEKVGGFSSQYTVSGEDLDISFRLRRLGMRLHYTPEAVAVHLRRDNAQSLSKLVYRHCLGGFLAHKRNGIFEYKVPFWRSIGLFFREVFLQGAFKGKIFYAGLVFRMHYIVYQAWRDAQRESQAFNKKEEKRYLSEKMDIASASYRNN